MADNKNAKTLGSKDGPGPKSEDDVAVAPSTAQEQAGADQHLEQMRSNTFGDNTSSSGGANSPGLHGRDGGVSQGTSNNPAPSEEAVKGTDGVHENSNDETDDKDDDVKKL